MCRGSVSVKNCNFSSAGDDGCNVHGIHFKVTESVGDTIVVKFSHPQTYGFNPLRVNDTISFVDPKTLMELGTSKIIQTEMVDKYYIKLKLSTRNNPVGVGTVIEDVTACPDFEFCDNTLNRIVTRGLLVTTRGRVLVENNKFLNTGMSGILISDDALNWYESGPVRSVMIRGNAFMNCEDSAILISPENRKFAGFVHENIFIDKLTGLYNRYYLDKISGELKRKRKITMMMLDMNDFKSINDNFGHSQGDDALVSLAEVLEKTVGAKGTVVRYAGDEFVIILNNGDEDAAEKCKLQIKKNLEEFNETHKKKYKLSASIGVGVFDLEKSNVDKILKKIDKLMYDDKRAYYALTHNDRRRGR
jgi:diguanylate cyclase (GGDEF)-like protein